MALEWRWYPGYYRADLQGYEGPRVQILLRDEWYDKLRLVAEHIHRVDDLLKGETVGVNKNAESSGSSPDRER